MRARDLAFLGRIAGAIYAFRCLGYVLVQYVRNRPLKEIR